MSGDYSRIAFDPMHDDLGVLLQQGRPLTDADWNALVLQLRRRVHVETIDTFGVATVPQQTPDGFKIVPNGTGGCAINAGRLYLDGLQAEVHGDEPLTWEPHLEELIGTEPIDYTEQPYYPNPEALPDSPGPHLVYLDVWQREVTHLTRAELVEKAVGVDSCTRLQTVWQVKLLADVGDLPCATPLEDFPGWLPAHAPSGGRLSTSIVPVPGEPDPCLIPLLSGYKGKENQCYRLQVHVGGPLGVATCKWSRENGSVGARVTHIPSLNQIIVDSVGKDSVLRFSEGDCVEVLDNRLEFHNLPGELRRITAVDDPTRTITLETALPNNLFPTDPTTHATEPARHTRIQRWDQSGTIRDENGNELQDLNDSGSTGAITIPTGGIGVLLEHNIVAKFSMTPDGAECRSGDHWIFTARTIDGSIDELVEAPPRGIHHHYAKLALVTFPDDFDDCRHLCDPCEGGAPQPQPPDHEVTESCACTACVTPAQHSSGQLTVQTAINQVVAAGGGTVCLGIGTYHIAQPLSIASATSLRLVGKGVETILESGGMAVEIASSTNIALEALTMICRTTPTTSGAALLILSSEDIAIERVAIRDVNLTPTWSAVGFVGTVRDIRLTGNTLSAFVGIRGGTIGSTPLFDLRIDDNTFDCKSIAIQLIGQCVHHDVTRLTGNRVIGCDETAFVLTGSTAPGSGVDIAGNRFEVKGSGIEATVDRLRVFDNDIAQFEAPGNHTGVSLIANAANPNGPEGTQIGGNRIAGFQEAAIVAGVNDLRGLEIKENQIEAGGEGVVLHVEGLADQVVIANNQFSKLRGFGIRADGRRARILTSGNQIETEGGHPPVRVVFVLGENVFTDNICRRSEGPPDVADVVLGADTVIVASNRVHGNRGSSVIAGSVDLQVDERRYTLLGNIVGGTILVKGQAVDQKWQPFNLVNIQAS